MKFKKSSDAAIKRWRTSPFFLDVKRKLMLKRDLVLLRKVMRTVRAELMQKTYQANARKYALERHHSSEKFKRRGRTLATHLRNVLQKAPAQKIKNQIELEKVYRRVLWRQRGEVERRIANRLRRRFEKAFRHRKSSQVCMELTGTSVAGLRAHLESLFQPGMTWENYGFLGWHIDHKIPICSFDLTDTGQQHRCFHYSNLQPLWKDQNFAKGRKVPQNI